MSARQTSLAIFCLLLTSQLSLAVVNNGQTSNAAPEKSSSSSTESKAEVADSTAESTEQEAKRRDAPIGLGDSYGAPIGNTGFGSLQSSYVPSGPSNTDLPVPVYGVPDAPSNNVIYPAPPPDIPPLPIGGNSLNLNLNLNQGIFRGQNQIYGPPKPVYGPPKETYGPPKPVYGPPKHNIGLPPLKYGPPIQFRPQKPFNPVPLHIKHSKPFYGPPPKYGVPFKFNLKPPTPQYGPPKPHYGPPKPIYGPPKFNQGFNKPSLSYGPPLSLHPPREAYGPPFLSKPIGLGSIKDSFPIKNFSPPKLNYGAPHQHYGPPDPVPNGPPHPGAPAPPTPPDIKYDGWQPIPGLISRPPSDSYTQIGGDHGSLPLDAGFVPPNLNDGGKYAGLSDSYGAPLNAVTGSGASLSSSGDANIHTDSALSIGLSTLGLGAGEDTSVIKSIGYELVPSGPSIEGGAGNTFVPPADSYSSPPINSFSADGPYPAAHSDKGNGFSNSFSSSSSFASSGLQGSSFSVNHGFGKGLSFPPSNAGLIPPSGQYGIPPSGQYGTPLLGNPQSFASFNLKPPRQPVAFREPVPSGLLESIGQGVAHKDAHGIIDTNYNAGFTGPAYIPPPVPDVPKSGHNEVPPPPTNLYSLPTANNPTSFQNIVHGSSNIGLGNDFSQSFASYNADSSLFNFNGAQAAALTGFTTQTGYNGHGDSQGLSVSLDQHLPTAIDLTSTYNAVGSSFNVPHDCPHHRPHVTYGVPIQTGPQLNGGLFVQQYANSDLQTAHSESAGVKANSIDTTSTSKFAHAKFLGDQFPTGGELIKSQSLDFNNIPVQGALGTYTLQISPAGGAGLTNGSTHIPHDQVLNDGLLQSILAAIEQPQQQNPNIYGQQLFVPSQHQLYTTHVNVGADGQVNGIVSPNDGEGQHSLKSEIVVPAPSEEKNAQSTNKDEDNDLENNIDLIDKNDIALFFNNTDTSEAETKGKEEKEVKLTDSKQEPNNGQQYGSFVSFETPKTSYVYGDLKVDKEGGEKEKKQ